MTYDHYHRIPCPFCESGELRSNPALARCTVCGATMDHGSFRTLLQIRTLADTRGERARESQRHKERGLPDDGDVIQDEDAVRLSYLRARLPYLRTRLDDEWNEERR